MNLLKTGTVALLLSTFHITGQTVSTENSHILRTNPSDTVLYHIELSGASYDAEKNKYPHYIVSQSTAYDVSANPALVVKKTLPVAEPHASVIKKYLSAYLTNQFTFEKLSSLSRNENLNQYKLFPFRYNALNQLEELISYDVTWSEFKNDNPAARGAATFANTSVLATGNWYKVGITQTGIHKVTKSFLSGIGISASDIDPAKIRIYGNGGKMVPELNSDPRIDDLEENSIQVVKAEDGTFDYALFYATGTTEWKRSTSPLNPRLKFTATKNMYSDTSFYFITFDGGTGTPKRITQIPGSSQTPNASSTSYDYYNCHEENTINFGKSGRKFFGEYFDLTTSYRFAWNDGDFVVNDSLITEVRLAGLAKTTSYFSVSDGGGLNFTIGTGPVDIGNTYADYAADSAKTAWGFNLNPSEIGITVSKQSAKSLGWLDKLTVNARRSLNLRNKQFSFRDTRVAGKTCNYTISVPSVSGLSLWNVTDPINPMEQEFVAAGSAIGFVASSSSLNEYCIAPATDMYIPVFFGKVPNQNLHSLAQADFLIIAHPLFVKEAERLGMLHLQKDTLTFAVATTDQVYNEFGSGKLDISAIRDFIRMVYSRNITTPGKELKYVLLMGDGSFNNKTRSLVNNSNLVPTYQSQESLSSTSSIATDDFYGLMDPDEGYYAEGKGRIDLGIGRFTCRTVAEVRAVIAKIENYYRKDPNFQVDNTTPINCNTSNESPMGDWRNWLLFLGDDEDAALHMKQSDLLSSLLKTVAPNYNIDKILLDSYQRFSTPGGNRYPDASEDFLRRIKKGALIFNYTGHGGEVGLTAERMIDVDIINGMDNFNKLPLFITATCEFSRYDDPSRTSAGELCLLNPKGGAVGLFTTCRLAFAEQNYMLNADLLAYLFTKLPNGKWPAFGDAIRKTKAHPLSGQTFYNANFHLLGDPAMRLAYPEQKVMTSAINNVPVKTNGSDTLGALAKITIAGYVADNTGKKKVDFNGVVYPTVFDKEAVVSCLMNSPTSARNYRNNDDSLLQPFKFKLQKNILYRGKAQVTNGDFSFTFIVPKDISFAVGPGKISYYATNGQTDANGYYSQVVVGGDAKNIIVDNDGPQVSLFLNDKSFVNGGITNEKPVLYADLTDSSGINTVGTGIGHDISVVLDGNTSKPVILNDFYEANLNSYQSGRVRYPYEELSEGNHQLSFKVWDIQNNSNTVYSDFVVAKSAELALKHVLNYPNPFTTSTKFIFQHNQACNPLKVTIQVYTVSGKIVKTIQRSVTCEGFKPEGIEWDGKDDYGDKLGRGVYIYKLAILDVENKKAEKIEKLVILN